MAAALDERLARFAPFADERASGVRALRYVLLDVFADTPLQGNQLAVFTDGRGLERERMQALARELNLSESAFVLEPREDGEARVRIFTPATELPFAGHPVLGTAVVVGRALDRPDVTLETGRGPIAVALQARGPRSHAGWMRQPVPHWSAYEQAAELLQALGVQRSGLPVEAYENGPLHVYVELADEAAVAALDPDLRALARLGALGANCFAGGAGCFKTRMFAPGLGVSEDPATGSAAGPLAVHLCRHGRAAFGEQIEIRQGHELGRPARLYARAHGRGEKVAGVEVGGTAVIVGSGEIRL